MSNHATPEVERIAREYERRRDSEIAQRYSPFHPNVYLSMQETERGLLNLLKSKGILPGQDRRILEIGCGGGRNLLQFIRYGFRPEHIVGNELLPHRAQEARAILPAAVQVYEGDAAQLDLVPESFDLVYQSTVMSSILDDDLAQSVSTTMWNLTKPGGGVLWYDLRVDNPRNPQVRGFPLSKIRQLFPEAIIDARRITLAPPISRRVAPIHPSLYTLFNVFPFLRTHLLCWLGKPAR